MIKIRKAEHRGQANYGWLDTHYTFSFADYYDPAYRGFQHLKVLNEDRLAPGGGFSTHPHRDMEIITYVIQGALEHKDSIGNGSLIRPGEVQRMSAGTGIRHSEFNPSKSQVTHLLQIWITPQELGLVPSYEQRQFPSETKLDRWCLIASREGREGSVVIHQEVDLYVALMSRGKSLPLDLNRSHGAWVQIISGTAQLNGVTLSSGDGASITDKALLDISSHREATELLLFDMRYR